eukprot:TRINITY_DN15379_c0_g1_i3.p1 TRINITY_DN15379_c0_g1~~TRINITY_DN15379_c0_g1_i3.p1  ORF type:complete len:107 (-),score=21.35 TRINITY_DN15379_c0_g1_i3:42-362(-)
MCIRDRCKTIPGVIWGLHHWNNLSGYPRANMMLYPRDARCSGTGVSTVFDTMEAAKVARARVRVRVSVPWSCQCRGPVSYTHLRAHETPEHLVCRLLLEKKKKTNQ